MSMRPLVKVVALLLVAAAGVALAAATNPTIYTSQSDCNKLSSLKGVESCRKCLPNNNGEVWIVGQGCGKHPTWVNGTAVTTGSDCQWAGSGASACSSCVGGGSQYIVGSGCCTDLNQKATLTQGCVLNTPNLCKKITSATAVSNCLSCLQSGKKFTLGSGCSQ